MESADYLDSLLTIVNSNQATFVFSDLEYSGSPDLGEGILHRLHKAAMAPESYGRILFEAIFREGDDLVTGYRAALTIARREKKRLRVRLCLTEQGPSALRRLVWEELYDPRERIVFGRSREIVLTRFLRTSIAPPEILAERPKILAVVSAPHDLATYHLAELDVAAHHATLGGIVERADLESLTGPASPFAIRARLLAERHSILHVVAHGRARRGSGAPHLVLEDDAGHVNLIGSEVLAETLIDLDLRLVVLVACHGGAHDKDPFEGLATALVRRGIPAVVAMRREIGIEAATCFVEHFYTSLARQGRVEVAVNEARHQLYLADPDDPAWATPVLFQRLKDGEMWRPNVASENVDKPPEVAEPDLGKYAPSHARPSMPYLRRGLSVALMFVVVVTVVVTVWSLLDRAPPPEHEVSRVPFRMAEGSIPGVALLGFEVPDLSDHETTVSWPATALVELLSFELAAAPSVRLISLKKLVLPPLDPVRELESSTRELIRRGVGAEVIVWGRVEPTASEIGVEIRLIATDDGRQIDLPSRRIATESIAEAVLEIRREIVEMLGLPPSTITVDAPPPMAPEVSDLYAKGRAALRLLDAMAARKYFQEALRSTPRHPSVHAGLAEAFRLFGQDSEARRHAREAAENATRLERSTRLDLHVLQLITQRQWPRAAAMATVLSPPTVRAGSVPAEDPFEDLDRGLRVAWLQGLTDMDQFAYAMLDSLRKLPAGAGKDLRIALIEAEVAKRQPDYLRELGAARRAARRAESLGHSLVRARGLQLEGQALTNLGRPEEALRSLTKAREIYQREGHEKGLGEVWYLTGVVRSGQGEFHKEKRCYDRALVFFESIGDHVMANRTKVNKALVLERLGQREASIETSRSMLEDLRALGDHEAEAMTLLNLVSPLVEMGELGEARRSFETAKTILDALGRPRLAAWAATVRGQLLIAEGRLAEAKATLEKASELRRKSGDRQRGASTSADLARALYRLGRLEQAAEVYAEVLEIFCGGGEPASCARNRRRLGDVRLAQGELDVARALYEEALETQNDRGLRVDAARTQLSLAELLFHEERFSEAERRARESATSLARDQLRLEEAMARRIFTRCLLVRGATREARREIERARELLGGEEVVLFRLPVEIAAARVLAAEGDAEAARAALQSVLANATANGFRALELEALIALAELGIRTKMPDLRGFDLAALERDAQDQGFGLLARSAARLGAKR